MFCLIYCALEPDRMPDTAVYHLPIPSLCTLPCQVAWLFVLPQEQEAIPTVDSPDSQVLRSLRPYACPFVQV
jgi:hypothetical protein